MIGSVLSILNLFLSMGLPALDQHLQEIIAHTDAWTPPALNSLASFARVLGCALCLCMAAYESYMMILARRGIDVMKLLRIVGISLCISQSYWITRAVALPGEGLYNTAYATAFGPGGTHADVDALIKECAEEQKKYNEALREKIDTLTEKQIQKIMDEASNDATGSWTDRLTIPIVTAWEEMKGEIKKMIISTETLIGEVINEVLRFIGEVIFQLVFFGLLLAQNFMMAILKAFCPVAFALSIVPPWASAWSQWISKYASISLWGFLVMTCVCYVDFILMYEIQLDITAYQTLMNAPLDGSWGEIGALGLQQIGATCRVVMAYVIGAIVMKFVPEIASWLIPGGASSSIGSAVGGLASSAVITSSMFAANKSISTTKSVSSYAASGGGAAVGSAAGAAYGAGKGAVQGASAGAGAARSMGAHGGTFVGALGTTMFTIAGAAGGFAEGAAHGGMEGGRSGYQMGSRLGKKIKGK